MLKYMRTHATSWMIKIILGAIVVVFVFWGVGSFQANQKEAVAVVNGDSITLEEYSNAYNTMLEQYRQRFGGSLNEDVLKMLNLKQMAIDRLIEKNLMLQETKKLNLRVSDEELTDAVLKMSVFQSNGTFDKKRYEDLLQRNRLTPEQFEAAQRESLLLEKLRYVIQESAKVSESESLEWYKWKNTSVRLEYVTFDPETYANIEPTPEEIQAYYDAHIDLYKTEPKIKAQFLQFKTEAFKASVSLSDDEITAYYNEHPDEFKNPKTVEARHILIKAEEGSPQKEIDQKKETAMDVYRMAKDGKDFAELAKTYSEDPGSKDNGGSLGAFRREAMVKPFSDKAFSMQPGEIGEPVLSRYGWHIIKVDKVNEESIKTLEQAKPIITQKIIANKAKSIAYDEAEKVFDAFIPGNNLAELAKDRNLEIQLTEYFSRKGPDQGVINRSRFGTAAFDLPVMEISDIQDFGDGYYLIQVLEKIPEETALFDDVKDKVKADVIKERQDEKAKANAEQLLTSLKAGEDMTAASQPYQLTPTTTDFFKRGESIPEIGYESEIQEIAFQLSETEPFIENPIKGRKGYYVIRYTERKEPDAEAFDKEKSSITDQLLQQKKYKLFESWLAKLKDKSQINIDQKYIQ